MIRNAIGTLIPIGGNEEKGIELNENETLEFIGNGILSHVVKETGGTNKKYVIIPTASSIPVEVGGIYLEAFAKLGCEDVTVLDIRKPSQSEEPNNIALINGADCVMFSGGNQSKIAKKIGGSTIHNILAERYTNDASFVIAGTSAGAMAMSQEMIAGGKASDSFTKGSVAMRKGLGLIPEIMFDTHFVYRGRFGRITQAVAKFPHLLGIGLAEDTGVIIKNGETLKVIGSGMVIIFDGSELLHNNEAVLKEGTPMSITNLKLHVLSNTDRFNIKTKKAEILPIDAPFEY